MENSNLTTTRGAKRRGRSYHGSGRQHEFYRLALWLLWNCSPDPARSANRVHRGCLWVVFGCHCAVAALGERRRCGGWVRAARRDSFRETERERETSPSPAASVRETSIPYPRLPLAAGRLGSPSPELTRDLLSPRARAIVRDSPKARQFLPLAHARGADSSAFLATSN